MATLLLALMLCTACAAATAQVDAHNAIDVVVPWCGPTQDMTGNRDEIIRDRDNKELLYLLRSIAWHAPWVNHIWVLMNPPVPDMAYFRHLVPPPLWNRTTLFNRCKLLPVKHCPTVNPFQVMSFLHRLPGLAEAFVMADDDIFLGRPIHPETLFQRTERGMVPYVWRDAPTWGGQAGQHPVYTNPEVAPFPIPRTVSPYPHYWCPALKSAMRYRIAWVRSIVCCCVRPWFHKMLCPLSSFFALHFTC